MTSDSAGGSKVTSGELSMETWTQYTWLDAVCTLHKPPQTEKCAYIVFKTDAVDVRPPGYWTNARSGSCRAAPHSCVSGRPAAGSGLMSQQVASPQWHLLTSGTGQPACPGQVNKIMTLMQFVHLNNPGECFIVLPVGVVSAGPSVVVTGRSADFGSLVVCGPAAPPSAASGH